MADHDPILLAVERINQMLSMHREELESLRQERDVMKRATQTLLTHLDSMEEHWAMAQRNAAAATRLESELRESVRELHNAIDKLPGKRRQ